MCSIRMSCKRGVVNILYRNVGHAIHTIQNPHKNQNSLRYNPGVRFVNKRPWYVSTETGLGGFVINNKLSNVNFTAITTF